MGGSPVPSSQSGATSASAHAEARTLRNLIVSLFVVAAFVLFLFVVVWRPQPEQVRTVDPQPMLASARMQADYPVLAPTGLDEQWKATSARFEAVSADETEWFLGYVTPQGQYLAVAQTDADPGPFIEQQTVSGRPDGEVTVDGRQWRRYTADNGHRSLVLTGPESTTVVTGTVSYDELAGFAQRLRS